MILGACKPRGHRLGLFRFYDIAFGPQGLSSLGEQTAKIHRPGQCFALPGFVFPGTIDGNSAPFPAA
jgi:hypothetical protein